MRPSPWIAIIAVGAACSEATAPQAIDIAAHNVVIDGTTALMAGDSLVVRTLSYAQSDVARWPVRIYLSSNPEISTQDTPIRDAVVEASARTPNWSRGPLEVRARIPPGMPTGQYYLGLMVDPDGVAGDTNAENNTARSTFRITVGVVPSSLAAPQPSLPADQSELAVAPAAVTLRWSAVAQAARYHVELANCPTAPATGAWWAGCAAWETWAEFSLGADSLPRPFFGPMVWRWRVRGVDSSGVAGPASAWRTFRYY